MKTVCSFLKARHRVDMIVDGLKEPVDERIRDLVATLLMFGIKTTGSCEGHVGRGRPYPWVSAAVSSAKRLCKCTALQNRPTSADGSPNLNRWVIYPSGPEILLVPWDITRPLEILQRDAEDFAKRLRCMGSL